MKIVVLSPHRDDAAFSVGLAIGCWISAGHGVEVINCFTESRYSPFGELEPEEGDRQRHVTALRRREDVLWSKGYQPAVGLRDLKLEDAPQRLGCGVDEVCDVRPRVGDEAMAEIRRAVEGVAKDALVLPLGLGEHVDHLTARLAVERGWPDTLPVAFYEDLPYAARAGVAEGIAERVASISSGLMAGFACEPVADAVERKRRAALCYRSQIDAEGIGQITGFCERYGGRERLWRSRAWVESGLGGCE